MSRRLGKIVLGNVLMTFSYAFLTVPLKIINGGVTSFALILSEKRKKCRSVPVY